MVLRRLIRTFKKLGPRKKIATKERGASGVQTVLDWVYHPSKRHGRKIGFDMQLQSYVNFFLLYTCVVPREDVTRFEFESLIFLQGPLKSKLSIKEDIKRVRLSPTERESILGAK